MKKKLIITLLVEILLIIIISIVAIKLYVNGKPNILSTEFTYELGDEIVINVNDVIDKDVDFEFDGLDQVDKFKCGEYNLILNYSYYRKEYSIPLSIKIKDTKAPEFIETKDLFELEEGTKPIDFSKFFKASDLDEITYTFDVDNIDYSTPGLYEASVSASDSSGNVETYPYKVRINEIKKVTLSEKELKITYVKGLIVVNKKHPLPADYNPGEDPTAAKALKELITEAQNNNLDISNSYSGFRSYDYQAKLYQNYVNRDGQERADRYSARAGYSEHQTGLAFDLCSNSGALLQSETECKWVKDNAYKYGFIVRYLEEKEDITGYMYEPWHLRYVGDLAKDIYDSGLTLEEYLGVAGGISY